MNKEYIEQASIAIQNTIRINSDTIVLALLIIVFILSLFFIISETE